ncbi:hypothetical protein K466DRAFT_222102 [Polyporus arcularius HHB13444]|uniref:Uncharacterized protein n=1 Tax=Polyporus arcularius HHB13444 TaxID=1314778 RepID=A0A5C3P4D9_9APHY|nr:hypothetical protein K466DRAFT_222102 [Polyporus arcularius HHB13444]
MQPWTVSEIHVYLSLIRKMSPKTGLPYTLEEARDIQREVGPCPRDIRTALRGGLESYKSNVHEIVARLDIAEINRVLLALPTLSYHNSDHIALLGRGGRDGEIDATSVQDDVAVVNFKTEHIAELVRRGFLQYELHSAARLFSTCSTLVQGRTAALAGILFEGMNIALLCDLDSYKIDRSRGFSRMEEVQIKSADLPRRFEYHSVRSETTLLVDEDWTLRLIPEPQTFSSRCAPSTLPATNPDIQKLVLHRYTFFEDITELALGGCYVPREPNPHFDGFFLLHAGGQIELWVMQATVSRPHAAVPGSFETVQKVFAKANKTFNGKVLLKYLLVAPYQSGLSVVFNMAKEWSAVKTKFQVYLQFIEVAPNWTAEDIIRPCCSARY